MIAVAALSGALPDTGRAAELDAAVAYRQNAAHTGFSATDLTPPLTPRWSRDFGERVSYPLIVDGRVFAVVSDAAVSGFRLEAVDASTGKTLWSRSVTGDTSRALPAYDDGTVYLQDGDGLLRAFDAVTGRRLWVTGVGSGSETTAPVAVNGVVYTKGPTLQGIAVDGRTGDQLWTYGHHTNAAGSSPAVADGVAIFSDRCPGSAGVDTLSHTELWFHDHECSGGGSAYPPVLAAGRAFLRDSDGRVVSAHTGEALPSPEFHQPPAVAGDIAVFMYYGTVTARSVTTNATLWSTTLAGTTWAAPLIVGTNVYVGSDTGELRALDLATGAERWSTEIPGGVAHSGEGWLMPSMAAAHGLLLVLAEDGTLYAFAHEASPPAPLSPPSPASIDTSMPAPSPDAAVGYRADAARSGFVAGPDGDAPWHELWSRPTEQAASYPVVRGDRVFVVEPHGLDRTLLALDRESGEQVWAVPLSGWWSGPLAYDGLIVIDNYRGEVRAFDANTGAPRWSTLLDDDPDRSQFGSTLTAAGGAVLLTGENYLWALDAATGKRRWKQLVDSTASASVANGLVFMSDTCHSTIAFALTDGQRRWGNIGCGGGSEKTTAVHRGQVWSREFRYYNASNVLDAASGRALDAYAIDEPPAFAGDLAVFLSGTALQAYDIRTGVMRWEHRGPTLSAAPLIVGSTVFSATADGVLQAFDVRTGELQWTAALGAPVPESADHEERPQTGLGAGDGLLVVPTANRLVAYAPRIVLGAKSGLPAAQAPGSPTLRPVFPPPADQRRALRKTALASLTQLRRTLRRRGFRVLGRAGGVAVGFRAPQRSRIAIEVRGRGRALVARGHATARRQQRLSVRLRARPGWARRARARRLTATARVRTADTAVAVSIRIARSG